MDEIQKDHLKSYGIAYWVLKNGETVDWLLNYRGGSFMMKYSKQLEDECNIRGVSYEVLADAKAAQIIEQISDPSVNMEVVKLEKPPRMAVYSPPDKGPLEDAVVLVLHYAEIPFDMIYDEEVLKGDLSKYDWLHLHHEDFTGQYSKFNRGFSEMQGSFNQRDRETQEALAAKLGYKKVSKMKLAVAQKIRDFTGAGGFLFAMCSGADSFDIALAAANTDIVDEMYDGDGYDPQAQSKLDFSQTLAFQNFTVALGSGNRLKFSDIDVGHVGGGRGGFGGGFGGGERRDPTTDFFTLFDFSAKYDVVPSMLTQDHDKVIKGFMGLATAFNESKLKPGVTIMGERKVGNEARYIHGEYGKGQWTFYGGHDPEDYQHGLNDPPTDLKLHPNSPGYRLILNNVLFPAAKKKHQKT
ncbi:MAG: asparagine synthetase B [Mucilaginibacter sp.]